MKQGKNFYKLAIFLMFLKAMVANAAIKPEREVRLQPQMRVEYQSSVLYEINSSDILPHLENFIVFNKDQELKALPYVLGYKEGNIMGGQYDTCYIQGNFPEDISIYSFISKGLYHYHPKTKEFLGIEADVVGQAEMIVQTNPRQVHILKAAEPIVLGQRMIPKSLLTLPEVITVVFPERSVSGHILSIKDSLGSLGKLSSIVISLGEREGIMQGHLLDIVSGHSAIIDTICDKKTQLPRRKQGEVLIIKVYKKMSLGLVLKGSGIISKNDKVGYDKKAS